MPCLPSLPLRWLLLLCPVVALAALICDAAATSGQGDKGKLPEPDKEAVAKAEKILNKLFAEDLAKAKSDPAAARELAETLLREARQTNDNPPLRFVALVRARDLAAQGGDTGTGMTIIQELAKHYAIDTLLMKTTMLSLAANKATSKDDHMKIVELALALLQEALAHDNYKAADELVKAAEDSAAKTKNLQLAGRVEKYSQEVEQAKKEFARIQKSLDTLAKKPNDPAANTEVGKYFGLVKGNWERALPLLAQGSDKDFVDLAKRDLANSKETRAQLDLGDDYALLADNEKGLAQKMLLKRAAHWYGKCLPNLEGGLNKVRVEKAIEEIAKLFPSTPIAAPVSSGAITTLIRTFDQTHFNGVQVLAISPDSKHVVSGGVQESIIRMWQVSDGKETRQIKGHLNEIWGLAFSPDGSQFASASTDKTARTWDTATGNNLRTFNGHIDWVRGVHYFPDKTRLLTASDDKTLRIWDLASGNEVRKMTGHTNFVNSLSVSKDGKRAATGSVDNTVRVWDLDKAEQIASFILNQEVWAVAISPDGKKVVSATINAGCKIWDIDGKKEILTLPTPARVWSVAYSPNGKIIALGAGGIVTNIPAVSIEGGWPQQGVQDNSIYFYEADTGKPLRRLVGHNGNVRALAYSNDGRLLVSGGDDRVIRLWGEGKK